MTAVPRTVVENEPLCALMERPTPHAVRRDHRFAKRKLLLGLGLGSYTLPAGGAQSRRDPTSWYYVIVIRHVSR